MKPIYGAYEGGKDMMRRTLVSTLMTAILSIYVATTALAAPEITGIQGGYGIRATVLDADQYNWRIEIVGLHILRRDVTEGTVNGDGNVTIRTPLILPAFGYGIMDIKVTLLHHWLPVDMEKRSALMLGPFLLVV